MSPAARVTTVTALLALEWWRSATFRGLGAEVCGPACAQGMTVASSETELSLLRALQAGATWTGVQVRSHGIAARPTCPSCGRPPETEATALSQPALVGATGRLATTSVGRSRSAASLGHAVSVASLPAGNRPRATESFSIRPANKQQSMSGAKALLRYTAGSNQGEMQQVAIVPEGSLRGLTSGIGSGMKHHKMANSNSNSYNHHY